MGGKFFSIVNSKALFQFIGRDTIYLRDVRNMYRLLCCSCGILGSLMKATCSMSVQLHGH